MDCEEIFGPVLVVHKFKKEAEAIEAANDSEYGLMSAVWTNNLLRAHRVARQLQAGTIAINNDTQIWTYNAPYGSIKMEVDRRLLSVILAPPVRMDFRNLTEDMFKPGQTVTFEGYPSKQTKDEFRAINITIGNRTTELR